MADGRVRRLLGREQFSLRLKRLWEALRRDRFLESAGISQKTASRSKKPKVASQVRFIHDRKSRYRSAVALREVEEMETEGTLSSAWDEHLVPTMFPSPHQ